MSLSVGHRVLSYISGVLLGCTALLDGGDRVQAGYTVTREVQATLTVNPASGTATASTSKGFVFSATNMQFTAPISTGASINNFDASAGSAQGTEYKMSLSVSTPDITPAVGQAAVNSLTLPGFSTQSYTAGGDGAGMNFNIAPSGEIQPPASVNAGSSFTTKRSSSLSVF